MSFKLHGQRKTWHLFKNILRILRAVIVHTAWTLNMFRVGERFILLNNLDLCQYRKVPTLQEQIQIFGICAKFMT